jgi:hypothetical protein
MVRFLFEYALPLDDKTASPPHSIAEQEVIAVQEQVFSQQGRLTIFGNSPSVYLPVTRAL